MMVTVSIVIAGCASRCGTAVSAFDQLYIAGKESTYSCKKLLGTTQIIKKGWTLRSNLPRVEYT